MRFFESTHPFLKKCFLWVLILPSSTLYAEDWPSHRMMDAREILGLLDDVLPGASMMPLSPFMASGGTISLVGQTGSSLFFLNRYGETGGTCDPNNEASNPPNSINSNLNSNKGNTQGTIHYNSCDLRTEYSKGEFFPAPALGRAALLHRLCRKLTQAPAIIFAPAMSRIRSPIVPQQPNSDVLSEVRVESKETSNISTLGQHGTSNWCSLTAPNYSDLNSLYQMFYPGGTIPRAPASRTTSSTEHPNDSQKSIPSGDVKAPETSSTLEKLLDWVEEVFEIDTKSIQSWFPEALIPVNKLGPPVSGFLEELLGLIRKSDQIIDQMSDAERVELEGNCDGSSGIQWQFGPTGSTYQVMVGPNSPSAAQVRAINAWRAAFMAMCTDPGWNSKL
ncbi:MAG: hypothetical protein KGP28_02570 [Bdellovibrionales bacterium]|nr:hypothetical protein [Bdellovibrionales bacterium]